jgi:hypothetical protein
MGNAEPLLPPDRRATDLIDLRRTWTADIATRTFNNDDDDDEESGRANMSDTALVIPAA